MSKADAFLVDAARRHSPLHKVDLECTEALGAFLRMQDTCYEQGLTKELNNAFRTLLDLHQAAKAKWEVGG